MDNNIGEEYLTLEELNNQVNKKKSKTSNVFQRVSNNFQRADFGLHELPSDNKEKVYGLGTPRFGVKLKSPRGVFSYMFGGH